MRTVRTTMRPHEEIEVEDAEFLDLERQGLLVSEEEQAEEKPAAKPAPEGVKPNGGIGN